MDYKWLKKVIDESEDLSVTGLAEALNRSKATASKILSGSRPIKLDEIGKIETYIKNETVLSEKKSLSETDPSMIQLKGFIDPDVWREPKAPPQIDFFKLPYLSYYNLPGGSLEAYYLFRLLDEIKPGQFFICSKHPQIESFLSNGSYVVGTKENRGLQEIALYKVSKNSDGNTILTKKGSDEQQNIDQLKINGLVTALFRPIGDMDNF